MCEIFPEVENCCYFFTLRVGMLFIAVLAVVTGALTLSIIEQNSDANFNSLQTVADIRKPEDALGKLGKLIQTGIAGLSALFMVVGLLLLIATLTDQEGFIQIFIWVTFLSVMIGFIMIIAIVYSCMMEDECVLSAMDWLSGSAVLIMIVAYLFLWIYFISVANSYVVGAAP